MKKYNRYNYSNVAKCLWEKYNLYLVKKSSYKSNRYNRFNLYEIRDCADNVLLKCTLTSIGDYLTKQGLLNNDSEE